MPQIFLNDIDVVKHTEYIVPSSRVAKKPAPESWSLPAFSPVEIDDYNDPEEPNVSLSLDWRDPLALFKLFLEKPRSSHHNAKLSVKREPVIGQTLIDMRGRKLAWEG